jgi:uncharacterized protein YoxC
MTKIEKILLPVIVVAAAVVSVLWISEQQTSMRLSRELREKEDELESVQAVRRGLKQANEQLLTRLDSLQQTVVLQEHRFAQRPVVEVEAVPEWEFLPTVEEVEDLAASNNSQDEEQTLTPEQVAEREERRAEREERREEFRDRMRTDLQTRKDFFSQITVDGLAPEYQESHRNLMRGLTAIEALMDQMADTSLSTDERRELGRNLWQQSREVSNLMTMQRDVLLNDFAEYHLGLNQESTREFIEYMQTVNQMTTGSAGRGGPPPGRGRNR